jgi:hypothetical protein
MEKLTQTGNWIWRDGELSYAEFGRMDRSSKDAHLLFISTLGEDISTNDWYILKQYAPQYLPTEKPNNFFSIDETIISTEDVQTSVEIPEVNILVTFGKDYLLDYLNIIFKSIYEEWETDLKFITDEKFINNVANFMIINELTKAHIKAYKKIMYL